MTAPSIQATATTDNSTPAMDHTVNLPSGINAGDMLCVWYTSVQDYGGGGSSSGHSFTTPSGWVATEALAGARVTGVHASPNELHVNTRLYTRTASGSEGSTLSLTATIPSTEQVILVAVAARISPDGEKVAGEYPHRSVSAFALGTNPNPLITVGSFPDVRDILGLASFHVADIPSLDALTPPTGTTEVVEIVSASGVPTPAHAAHARLMVTEEEVLGETAYDPVACSGVGSTDFAGALTLAVGVEAVVLQGAYWGIAAPPPA